VASGMPSWERILLYAAGPSLVAMTAIIAFALHRIKTAKTKAKAEGAAEAGNTNIEKATNSDPKSVSKSIVTSENNTRPIIERSIPILQSLIDDINQKIEEISPEIVKNQETIDKLIEYMEDHKRDNYNAEVTDEELAEEYPTFGEAIEGLRELKKSNNALIKEISMTTEWGNREETNSVSHQNKINESEDSEANSESLNDYR